MKLQHAGHFVGDCTVYDGVTWPKSLGIFLKVDLRWGIMQRPSLLYIQLTVIQWNISTKVEVTRS